MQRIFFFILPFFLLFACDTKVKNEATTSAGNVTVRQYFNYSDTGVQTAGIKLIPIQTPIGEFKVWTKRFGNNPRIKVLLLHGGPAFTHEYMECFESFFPKEGFEFYEYDQLGSAYSDQPKDSSLWTKERFVEEVEQVRKAIGADKNNFFVLGNSWGGMLAMEYALKYQQNLKGLIVANMVASIPDYNRYANDVLAKQMDPKIVSDIRSFEAKKDYNNPRYEELLMSNFYNQHICRLNPWPEPVNRSFAHYNKEIYVMMQGPSEFSASGRLGTWDVKKPVERNRSANPDDRRQIRHHGPKSNGRTKQNGAAR